MNQPFKYLPKKINIWVFGEFIVFLQSYLLRNSLNIAIKTLKLYKW